LRLGEKELAIPFDAIHATEKDGKWHLLNFLEATQSTLRGAKRMMDEATPVFA
jgi:hypothetical protein